MRKFSIISVIVGAAIAGWLLGAKFGTTKRLVDISNDVADQEQVAAATPATIRGQGKFVPANGLVNIIASPGERIDELTDKRIGDQVQRDEVLVTLHSRLLRVRDWELAKSRRADALKNAEFDKQRAQYKLKSAQLAVAEAKSNDAKIAKQADAVELLRSQLSVAQAAFDRLKKLQNNTATKNLINQTDVDKQALVVEQLQLQINQSKQEIELATNSASRAQEAAENELKTVEFSLANSADAVPLQSLDAAVALSQAAYDATQLRSPIDNATIIDIIVNQGDSVTNQPIMVLADLNLMNCEVEVVDSIFGLIDLEQHENLRAKVTSSAIQKPLFGTVVAKGVMIGPISLKSPNPFARVDQRTGVVSVKMDDPKLAAQFVNLQVDVEIEIKPGALKSD